MLLPNRHGSSDSYRYGFNGMEKDDELKGEGNSYDFGARMLDPRIGRWFAPDDLEIKYTSTSPYVYVLNMPVTAIDPNGKDVYIIIRGTGNGEHDDAANTRIKEIKNRKGFDSKKDHVYVIELVDLADLQGQIKTVVDDANNNTYGKTVELSYYGHGGPDGPVGGATTTGPYNLSKETGIAVDHMQMSLKGWSKIDFNFDKDLSIAGFYGCQTASFAQKFSLVSNVTYAAGFGAKAGGSESYDEFDTNWFTIGDEAIYTLDGDGLFIYEGLGDKNPKYDVYNKYLGKYEEIDFTDYDDPAIRTQKFIDQYSKQVEPVGTYFSTNVYVEKDKDDKTVIKGHKYKEGEGAKIHKKEKNNSPNGG